jgi:phage N-6-adenine-methyltransferase
MMPAQKPGRSKQDYGTPPEFLEAVKSRLKIEEFAIDLAASKANAVSSLFLSEEDNSFSFDWHTLTGSGWAWLNPPFSNISLWAEKAALEAYKGAQIAMLVPASVGSNWWLDWVEPFAYTAFLNGRLTFVGCKDPYPKDCALLLYHPWGFTGFEVWNWRN